MNGTLRVGIDKLVDYALLVGIKISLAGRMCHTACFNCGLYRIGTFGRACLSATVGRCTGTKRQYVSTT